MGSSTGELGIGEAKVALVEESRGVRIYVLKRVYRVLESRAVVV